MCCLRSSSLAGINFTLVDSGLGIQDQCTGVRCDIVGGRDQSTANFHGGALFRVVLSALCDLGIVLRHRLKDHVVEQISCTIKARVALWLAELGLTCKYQV